MKNETTCGLEMTLTPDIVAAIATALHLYGGEVHDVESGVLTISQQPTFWNNLALMMRGWPAL